MTSLTHSIRSNTCRQRNGAGKWFLFAILRQIALWNQWWDKRALMPQRRKKERQQRDKKKCNEKNSNEKWKEIRLWTTAKEVFMFSCTNNTSFSSEINPLYRRSMLFTKKKKDDRKTEDMKQPGTKSKCIDSANL